jgi:hypothetical protein
MNMLLAASHVTCHTCNLLSGITGCGIGHVTNSSSSSSSSSFNVSCPCYARVGRVQHIKPRLVMWFEAVFFYRPDALPDAYPPPSSWLGTGTHNHWIAAHEAEILDIIIMFQKCSIAYC